MKIKTTVTTICVVLTISATILAADKAQSKADAGYLTLDRIIGLDEFDSESYGPVRWLEDGSGYTTLEDSQSAEEDGDGDSKERKARDIVRYDPETGEREILVSSDLLILQRQLHSSGVLLRVHHKRLSLWGYQQAIRLWRTHARSAGSPKA